MHSLLPANLPQKEGGLPFVPLTMTMIRAGNGKSVINVFFGYLYPTEKSIRKSFVDNFGYISDKMYIHQFERKTDLDAITLSYMLSLSFVYLVFEVLYLSN